MLTIDDATDSLRKHFGFEDFREGQRDVIATILSGKDAVVVMPTGSGKSLCYQLPAMMMEGAGFKVVNLGINNDAEKFIAAIHEHQPEILGMSALLTTTMPYMQVVIQALKEQGLRDKVIVLVGGAPLNAAFAEEIEADAYCRDAAVAVETAKKLVAIRRGEM